MRNIKFESARILVVGDIMLDRYWSGDAFRISPEAPVPVIKINEDEDRIGGAGNVAINIACLGGNVCVFSITGDDAPAVKLQQMLNSYSVESFFEKLKDLPTALKLRVLSRNQQLIRMDFEEKFDLIDKTNLLSNFKQNLNSANVVILSDYGKGVLKQPQEFISIARAKNIPVLVDPKGTDFTKYKNATLITPNRSEFTTVVGACDSIDQIKQKAIHLINDLNFAAILITLSEDGMLLVNKNGDNKYLATHAREVFDVTGAGDTVIASFATALGAGYSMEQAMEYSNLAAGIVVGKLGTSTVSHQELLAASLSDKKTANNKIHSLEHLVHLVRHAQKIGEKIVMTNGCFDILHTGHVSYLQAAKSLGDKLIVAVNSNESVSRLKGNSRPIQGLAERMEILAALEAVDYVVPFASDTPEDVYCEILPDVLVKGGDYSEDEVVGANCIKDNGGTVQILNFVKGKSTSSIIEKIKGL